MSVFNDFTSNDRKPLTVFTVSCSMEGNGDQGVVKQVRNSEDHPVIPDTEEDVLSQTKDVFVCFVRERVRIDEERDETRIIPSTPTGTYPGINRLVNAKDGTTAEVGRRLAKIGDDITKLYAGEFEDMKRQLAGKNLSTYESFKQIANRIFGDKEVNWGRITALFSFAYWLFKHVIWQFAKDFTNVVTDIAANIARYFKEGALGIAQWIAHQGGWSSANSYAPSVRPVVFWGIVAAAVVTIVGVVLLKSGKSTP